MTITLTLSREQEESLKALVDSGRFESVEEAVQVAVAELVRPEDVWAKPYLDVARGQIERREFVTHDEFKRDLADRIKTLGG
jgi:Arc/MetJ-type ribon-helix-helix transcriptional regulator